MRKRIEYNPDEGKEEEWEQIDWTDGRGDVRRRGKILKAREKKMSRSGAANKVKRTKSHSWKMQMRLVTN